MKKRSDKEDIEKMDRDLVFDPNDSKTKKSLQETIDMLRERERQRTFDTIPPKPSSPAT